jgi:hypothetical protein
MNTYNQIIQYDVGEKYGWIYIRVAASSAQFVFTVRVLSGCQCIENTALESVVMSTGGINRKFFR